MNSKTPYTLTLSLPFPVVRNQDLDHTIKPRHWTRVWASATSRFVALALAIGLAVWRAGGAVR